MGLYDTVWVNCPKCNQLVEFQTKAGESRMQDFTISSAPAVILADISSDSHICKNCDTIVGVELFARAKTVY
jgi:RNase P subunit RPR2